MNTRQDCRHGVTVSAVDELCAFAGVTRHWARMGVGSPRIIPADGRGGRLLASRDSDVLLVGFESGYSHTID